MLKYIIALVMLSTVAHADEVQWNKDLDKWLNVLALMALCSNYPEAEAATEVVTLLKGKLQMPDADLQTRFDKINEPNRIIVGFGGRYQYCYEIGNLLKIGVIQEAKTYIRNNQ